MRLYTVILHLSLYKQRKDYIGNEEWCTRKQGGKRDRPRRDNTKGGSGLSKVISKFHHNQYPCVIQYKYLIIKRQESKPLNAIITHL